MNPRKHEKRTPLEETQECCPDMSEYISLLTDERDSLQEEHRYLEDFIQYKGLEDEYRYFRKNAHEYENPDLPFPQLTL